MIKKTLIVASMVVTGLWAQPADVLQTNRYSCLKDYLRDMNNILIDAKAVAKRYASSDLFLFKEPTSVEYMFVKQISSDGKGVGSIPILAVCFQDSQIMMFKPIGVGKFGVAKNANFSEVFGRVFYKAYLSQNPDRYKVVEGKTDYFTIFFGDILFDRQSQIAFRSYLKDAKKNDTTFYYVPVPVNFIDTFSTGKLDAILSLAFSKMPLKKRVNFLGDVIALGLSPKDKAGIKKFISLVKRYGVDVITDEELKEEEEKINREFSYWAYATAPSIEGRAINTIYSKFPQKGAK